LIAFVVGFLMSIPIGIGINNKSPLGAILMLTIFLSLIVFWFSNSIRTTVLYNRQYPAYRAAVQRMQENYERRLYYCSRCDVIWLDGGTESGSPSDLVRVLAQQVAG
jgi:hypothetical protein